MAACMYLVEVLTSTQKCIFLRVVIGLQEKYSLRTFMMSGSHDNNHGDLEAQHISWRSPQRILTTKMDHDGWLSWKYCFREGTFVRVSHHGPFSCRFWLFSWVFSALTKSPFFGSCLSVYIASCWSRFEEYFLLVYLLYLYMPSDASLSELCSCWCYS